MKNIQKITLILLCILIIALNSFSLCIFITKGNRWRVNKADSLYKTSIDTEQLRDKLILLIESNFLRPSEAKNIEIADIYLELDDFNNAKYYLNRIKNQDGYLRIAESALEKSEFTIAEEYLKKIDNYENRNELIIFSEIVQNEGKIDNIKNLSFEPKTNLGVILKALNTNNFVNVSNKSFLGKKIVEIRKLYPEKARSGLELANMLIQENQPVLARLLLNNSEIEHSGITDIYVLKAESFVIQKDYQNSLKYQLLAIKTNPDDIILYQTALSYAELAGNDNEVLFLKENIKYLELIKSKIFCTNCGV